jgi:hypothetical protein
MAKRIVRVAALPAMRVRVDWGNGKQSEIDLSDYADLPGHQALREPSFFETVKADEWGHGIEWPGADIGVPADALYRLSREQSGSAFPTARFNEWMRRHGLSLADAAEALHLTRRTIIYYSTGAKPIPAHIGLACRGWEAIVAEKP